MLRGRSGKLRISWSSVGLEKGCEMWLSEGKE